jgi:4-hydroxy-tetrahydrodipicolinate synthase
MFSGSMVALVTPFKDGKVDWKSLHALVDFHLQSGTHGIVPCGTTGESATLSHQEHDEVIRSVIKSVNKRVPVIAGTGSNSTDEAVRLTREAEKSGADGALMISPYYNRPTQEGIYQHYRKVASEVGIPIIIYNIPGRTGSKIEPETLARLAEINNIAGVKEATGSVDQAIDVMRLCGDRLAVYSGEDSLIFSLMTLGGKGVISTVANLAPKETAQLTEASEGRMNAEKIQFDLIPLIRSLFIETNPIPVKTAPAAMGKCSALRLPLTSMAEGNVKAAPGDERFPVYSLAPMSLKIIVCGVGGRMGGAVVRAIRQTSGVRLVAAIRQTWQRASGKRCGRNFRCWESRRSHYGQDRAVSQTEHGHR